MRYGGPKAYNSNKPGTSLHNRGGMNATQINIVALLFIAAMLASIMLIAWRSFDRPRHALVWAIAFSVSTLGWAVNLALRVMPGDHLILFPLATALSCLFHALIALGFVQRARRRGGTLPLLAAAAVAALLIPLMPHRGLSDGIWLGFGGAMLVVSAANVSASFRGASIPERATALMLVLFAVVDLGLATIAVGQGAQASGSSISLFRLVLLLLYPPAFIGVGLFTVFLVAADLAERMRALAVSDLLTGIFNRRGFEEAADRAIRNAQRQRQPLALVVTDIDRFKTINDRHGHNAGDRAIQHFATRMERMVRRGDLVGRIGGEEFALLLVNTNSNDALEVVERIRRDVAAMPVNGPEAIAMTASFGITGLRPGDTSLANLFARADRALYRSKVEGRDRVTCAEAMEEPLADQAMAGDLA